MTLVFEIVFFTLGGVSASFIGLVASRLYTGASIVSGRSRCDVCGAILSAYALVPIFSWLLARGRCLMCQARITPLSLITEIVLGSLFLLAYLKIGLTTLLLLVLIALVLLTGIVLYDLAHMIVPPILLWLFIADTFGIAVLSHPSLDAFFVTLCTALLLGSLLALAHLVSGGRAMGLADAPFAFGLALLVGPSLALSGFFYSFWIGGVVGIILLLVRALGTTIQSEVPFAPFLAAGFLLAYFTQWDVLILMVLP
jgi:leader peptidase (prepilin peptidase)/N-methyltransferase